MDEVAARAWLEHKAVPRETMDALDQLAELVRAEAGRQNLVSRSTLSVLWQRHITDSAQLADLAGVWSRWADIGTGAGFPGIVIALLGLGHVDCIEPRQLRVRFLQLLVTQLGLSNQATVLAGKVEAMSPARPYDVISARAVAPLGDLLRAARHMASPDTVWLLPKGRSAARELAEAQRTWQGDFRLVPSITDPAASIVVARNVRPRTGR